MEQLLSGAHEQLDAFIRCEATEAITIRMFAPTVPWVRHCDCRGLLHAVGALPTAVTGQSTAPCLREECRLTTN